ncbi:hypothetical protein ES705_21852 [subsurface metagenome]
MPKKEPLYPHIPKSKTKESGQVKVIETGDRDWHEIGIHLKNPTPQKIEDAKEDAINKGFDTVYVHLIERNVYYCSIEERHPHKEIIQVSTTQRDPICPYCGGIMTYGRWWPVTKAEE